MFGLVFTKAAANPAAEKYCRHALCAVSVALCTIAEPAGEESAQSVPAFIAASLSTLPNGE